MAPVLVWPLASLSGAVEKESDDVADHFWRRVSEYGAHEDREIALLWSRVRAEETRIAREVSRLWAMLDDFGATQDGEIVRLWRSIISG